MLDISRNPFFGPKYKHKHSVSTVITLPRAIKLQSLRTMIPKNSRQMLAHSLFNGYRGNGSVPLMLGPTYIHTTSASSFSSIFLNIHTITNTPSYFHSHLISSHQIATNTYIHYPPPPPPYFKNPSSTTLPTKTSPLLSQIKLKSSST